MCASRSSRCSGVNVATVCQRVFSKVQLLSSSSTCSSAKLSDLGHAKLGHHQPQPAYMRSDPAQLAAVPAARKGQSKGRPDDRILGRGKGDILGLKGPLELKSSAVIKGGGTVVKSAAPKANYQLTEREMQANWDALC